MDPCLRRNYSYSYKENDDLCFLTGYFGLRVDASNLFKVKLGTFSSDSDDDDDDGNVLSYLEAPKSDITTKFMNEQLQDEELSIDIIIPKSDSISNTNTPLPSSSQSSSSPPSCYRLISADETRLWESGMICQHYDFKKLQFQTQTNNDDDDKDDTDDNKNLVALENCDATLYILVWPDSITFTMELLLLDESSLKSTGFSIVMKLGDKWQIEHTFDANACHSNPNCKLSLHCNCNSNVNGNGSDSRTRIMIGDNGNENGNGNGNRNGDGNSININIDIDCSFVQPKQEMSTDYSHHFHCHLLAKNSGPGPGPALIDRSFETGYTDIRDYDLFYIKVDNTNTNTTNATNNSGTNDKGSDDVVYYVPILLFVQHLANPTGLCPIVCDMDYKPTGIPIQLSKNWHSKEIRNYGRFYSLLPVRANSYAEYYVRIPYGFYGTLPTASHANLSLIGYFGHGTRWEQLAIGCFGETYCQDMDMGCVKQTITDIRMLFTKGEDGQMWRWSDAGWGGDWLKVYDNNSDENERLMPFSWKTAYESHGPCLTCMHVDGWYQSSSKGYRVELSGTVRTMRTDDYARTITTLSYVFKNELPTAKTHFFSMGGSADTETPRVALGCKSGLIEEINVDEDVEPDSYFIERKALTGSSPWFVGFPGQRQVNDKTWGKGFRAIIIRQYQASFSGVEYHNPCISLIGNRKFPNVKTNLRLEISPEAGIECFKNGDSVKFEVELITLPKQAGDYYGPNKEFRAHLVENEDSWKTIYRAAIKNDIYPILISGGILKSNYPVIIAVTDSSKVTVKIEGGVGALPVRFEGLPSTNYILYKISDIEEKFAPAVHGNDFFQIDFDTLKHFSITFNIPVSEKVPYTTTWELRKVE